MKALVLVIIFACAILAVMLINGIQGSLLYHPKPSSACNWEHGVYSESTVPDNRVFLFMHGNSANAYQQRLTHMQRVTGGHYYTLEYPGFGCRYDETHNRAALVRAADRAYLDVETRHPGSQIYLIGQSLGTGIAAEIAVRHPQTRGVILITPYTTMPAVYNKYVPGAGYLAFGHRYDCEGHAVKYMAAGGRVLVIGAELDAIIPFVHSQQLAGHGAQLVSFPGDHNDLFLHMPAWETAVREFVRETV